MSGQQTIITPEIVLKHVGERGLINTLEFANECGVPHQNVVGVMKSIEGSEGVILTEKKTLIKKELTKEGLQVCEF